MNPTRRSLTMGMGLMLAGAFPARPAWGAGADRG